MKKLALSAFAVVLLMSVFAPAAHALPANAVYIEYYDCAMNEVGWYYYDCYHTFGGGQQWGDFKYEAVWNCTFGNGTDGWWKWDSSTNWWTSLSSPPTGCPVDQTIDYYACWESYSGTHHVDCSGNVTDTGTTSGTYKHVVNRNCTDSSVTSDQWYHLNSQGGWDPINPPNPYVLEC
jgi:hypothetical protein